MKIRRTKSEKNFTFHHIKELEGILTFNEITNSFIKSYGVFIRLIAIDSTLASLQLFHHITTHVKKIDV